jgi:hypothetical protein
LGFHSPAPFIFIKELFYLFKGKAKTRIVLDKTYQKGQEVELTKEQYELLSVYLENVTEAKPKEVKPAKKASTKKTTKKE